MGSPAIYYYPDPAGGLETITLPELSDLRERRIVDVARSRSVGGVGYARQFSARHAVEVEIDGITDAATVRALLSLQAHLDRGGLIGFARDSAKGWSGYIRQLPQRGETVLAVAPMARYASAAALAASDEVWIESASPERHAELATVSTASATAITLSAGLRYSYAERPIIVRHRDYYPALSAPGVAPILTSERRLYYRLSLTLEEEPTAVQALVEWSEVAGATASQRFPTLPQAELEVRRRARTSFRRPG